jgi:hypothetical protein
MGEVGSLSVDAVHPQQRSDGSNSRRWVGPFLTGGNTKKAGIAVFSEQLNRAALAGQLVSSCSLTDRPTLRISFVCG